MTSAKVSPPLPGEWIDHDSPIPYYLQLKEAFLKQINDGKWNPGDQLPGEPELCRSLDVSRTVVRQALKELTYEGYVTRRKGKGTFVAYPKYTESAIQELSGFYKYMAEIGHPPISRVLKQGVVQASQTVASNLGLEPGADVIEIERLRFIRDEPLVLTTTYLPESLCPKLKNADLSRRSLYEFLETECQLVLATGHRTIEAISADEETATRLNVEKGAPLLLIHSVSYLRDGTPIEYYHSLHRGDRSRFAVELVRRSERDPSFESISARGIDLPPSGGEVIFKETPD